MSKAVLGHIDCPTCGTAKGMRVTHDRNGEPFGYCEAKCSQQLRVGGDKSRVADFVARYPWAAGPGAAPTVSAPVPAPAPAGSAAAKPAPEHKPEPQRVSRKAMSAGVFDALLGSAA